MLRKLLFLSYLMLGIGYTLEAAAIPPILSQEAIGEEAEKIELKMDKNKSSGSAIVKGCIRCPLKLNVDENTRFFENGEPIDLKRAQSLSGKSGTVIFEKDRTIRIRW